MHFNADWVTGCSKSVVADTNPQSPSLDLTLKHGMSVGQGDQASKIHVGMSINEIPGHPPFPFFAWSDSLIGADCAPFKRQMADHDWKLWDTMGVFIVLACFGYSSVPFSVRARKPGKVRGFWFDPIHSQI